MQTTEPSSKPETETIKSKTEKQRNREDRKQSDRSAAIQETRGCKNVIDHLERQFSCKDESLKVPYQSSLCCPQIFKQMLPLIQRHITCMPLEEVKLNMSEVHCPVMIEVLKALSIGFLLAGCGLTFSGFFICVCWGKLVKVSKKAKVAPTAGSATGKKAELEPMAFAAPPTI
jgi:hypothetical protein